jgi:two-component system, OmpR family, phosphate regulon sensor histidine kinase PhoR
VRRLLLVNALIFAVLAAAVALAYYGYSYATDVSSREGERRLLKDLAEEKVVSIETLIANDDKKLFSAPLQLEQLVNKLADLASGVHVVSVFVLDDKLKIVPGGYVSQREGKEGVEFRDWFEKRVVPMLALDRLPLGERGHLHGIWDGRPYLWSMMKRQHDGKVHYIVIEEDLVHLVGFMFPQFFTLDTRSKRLYQVVDERGELVYGLPFSFDDDAPSEVVAFSETVDGWSVRVTEAPDEKLRSQLARKRLVDSLFIGGATTVILTGLMFLAFAIRRERRANELKSEFISNVSHELKTPLSIISMFGEMLANGRTKSPEQATEYADIIWRESVRLGRLIDNVLDFAKIERGKGVYEFAEADVGEVVERAVDLVGRRLATAEMSISVEIEPDLPHVMLDGNAFTLAVMNLIDNAIKYAADGKRVEAKLGRRVVDGDERIVLTVRDFGPGIEPQEQEQIFERFYRARAVRLKPIRGSGIGLALVRHIARAHHGDVAVTSELGKGSTFELWLPIP